MPVMSLSRVPCGPLWLLRFLDLAMSATPAIIPRAQPLLGPTDIGEAGEVIASDGLGGVYWVSQSSGVTDHGALTGLSDDDHPQYVLAAGRVGGQTIVGGGGDLGLSGDATTGGTVAIAVPGSGEGGVRVYANAPGGRLSVGGVANNQYVQTQISGAGVTVRSGGHFGFSSQISRAEAASDTGIARAAAGVTRSTTGTAATIGDHQTRAIRLVPYTDANRPAAGIAGRVIYNSDDGNINIDTGTQWVTPDGTIT